MPPEGSDPTLCCPALLGSQGSERLAQMLLAKHSLTLPPPSPPPLLQPSSQTINVSPQAAREIAGSLPLHLLHLFSPLESGLQGHSGRATLSSKHPLLLCNLDNPIPDRPRQNTLRCSFPIALTSKPNACLNGWHTSDYHSPICTNESCHYPRPAELKMW